MAAAVQAKDVIGGGSAGQRCNRRVNACARALKLDERTVSKGGGTPAGMHHKLPHCYVPRSAVHRHHHHHHQRPLACAVPASGPLRCSCWSCRCSCSSSAEPILHGHGHGHGHGPERTCRTSATGMAMCVLTNAPLPWHQVAPGHKPCRRLPPAPDDQFRGDRQHRFGALAGLGRQRSRRHSSGAVQQGRAAAAAAARRGCLAQRQLD